MDIHHLFSFLTTIFFIVLSCPLCHQSLPENLLPYCVDKRRAYYQCHACCLVFVEPSALPSLETEKHEYSLHENTFEDIGYRKFLSKLSTPLLDKLKPGSKGLDFGSGPAPVLASMLTEAGMQMQYYDPIFSKSPSVLDDTFDFITCTEAVEHFHTPHKEFSLFNKMLRPEGWLAIMTKRVIDQDRFSTWHYKNDITHVSFFSEDTFHYLATHFHFSIEFPSSDVVLMQKLG